MDTKNIKRKIVHKENRILIQGDDEESNNAPVPKKNKSEVFHWESDPERYDGTEIEIPLKVREPDVDFDFMGFSIYYYNVAADFCTCIGVGISAEIARPLVNILNALNACLIQPRQRFFFVGKWMQSFHSFVCGEASRPKKYTLLPIIPEFQSAEKHTYKNNTVLLTWDTPTYDIEPGDNENYCESHDICTSTGEHRKLYFSSPVTLPNGMGQKVYTSTVIKECNPLGIKQDIDMVLENIDKVFEELNSEPRDSVLGERYTYEAKDKEQIKKICKDLLSCY